MRGRGWFAAVLAAALGGSCSSPPPVQCVPGLKCSSGAQCIEEGTQCSPCTCQGGELVCTPQVDCTPPPPPPQFSWSPKSLWIAAGDTTELAVTFGDSSMPEVSLAGDGVSAPVATGAGTVILDVTAASTAPAHSWGTVSVKLAGATTNKPIEIFVTGTAGSPDPTFGIGGCVQPIFAPSQVAPLADGSVVVGGAFDPYGPMIARLLPNGDSDSAFHVDPLPDGALWGLAAAPDGRVAISTSGASDSLLVLSSSGAVASTRSLEHGRVAWNAGEIVVVAADAIDTVDASDQLASSPLLGIDFPIVPPPMTIEPASSTLFLADEVCTGQTCAPSITKLLPAGALYSRDMSFGSSGTSAIPGATGTLRALAPGAAGDVYGALAVPSGGAVVHLVADGTLDTTWPNVGITLVPQSADVVAVDGDTLLVAGSAQQGAVVTRLRPGGNVDASFGSGGTMVFADPITVRAAAVDALHRLWVAGAGGAGTERICRVRLE